MKHLTNCLCLFCCLALLLPAAAEKEFEPYDAWCRSEAASPAAPHESGDRLFNALSHDQVVRVIGEKGEMLEAVVYLLSGEAKTLWLWKSDFERVPAGDWHRLVYINNPKPGERLNLRQNPQRGSLSLGRYYTGVMPIVLGPSRNGYTKVRLDMRAGYMMDKFLEDFDPAQPPETQIPLLLIAPKNSGPVILKLGPSQQSPNQGSFPFAETVKLLGQEGDWCHVEVPSGQTGFMPASAFPGQLK